MLPEHPVSKTKDGPLRSKMYDILLAVIAVPVPVIEYDYRKISTFRYLKTTNDRLPVRFGYL